MNRHNPTVPAPESDDLSDFLDFGLDSFDGSVHDRQCLRNHGVMAMNTTIEHSRVMCGSEQHGQIFPTEIQSHVVSMGGTCTAGVPRTDLAMQKPIIRQHLQFQGQHNARELDFQEVPVMPSTPNSMEPHEEETRYCQHVDANGRAVYERQPCSKEDQVSDELHTFDRLDSCLLQMAFTPLGTPAITPHETQFILPGYAVPDPYLSPFSSSQLEVQNTGQRLVYTSAPSSSTGVMTSPINLNVDLPASMNHAAANARKPRRKLTARNSGCIVGQSPAMRTHATESVSSQPLLEAPIPPSAPFLVAQSCDEPQTPATLMGLQRQENQSTPVRPSSVVAASTLQTEVDEFVEDTMLPESATSSLTPLAALDIRRGNNDQRKPTTSAANTTAFGAFGTSLTAPLSSVSSSPLIHSFLSLNDAKGPESRPSSGCGIKKRHAPCSSQVSPNVHPKTSTRVKALLPASTHGAVSAVTSVLHLSSKSNYENILEGNHLPGVSYPHALVENLTSKRTVHKIAEKGRRDRINTALNEMESLLSQGSKPPGAKGEKNISTVREILDSGGNGLGEDKTSNSPQGNSKANTVEMAIVYIRSLQSELAETKAKLKSAEKKLVEGAGG